MQEAGSSFIFSVIGELRFETLPAVPGKLSIAVNHTGNPTSQTIWLEGRNLCDLQVRETVGQNGSIFSTESIAFAARHQGFE